ncbi:unnamed protein product [Peronospora belbahrii]|uniref:PUB domain-containing protein n=1 Tax=Peronospora belbahrii TaxID=622444 RepID=A0AAU9L4U6_9STRA|nr:unnamed protein product [Peronospora belbahrii]CAH0522418.1 unnamed protein product [Peronospora belbahrii]
MDWLMKKKEEAKHAAAKISNKRTAFRGEGNVLGGHNVSEDNSSVLPLNNTSRSLPIKLPFTSNKPPDLSEEEQKKRREIQAKALEQRSNAWDKRVATARKARIKQEEEDENKYQYTEPVTTKSSSLPPPVVLTDEEVKARELQNAQLQMGFNPYEATFASSVQAVSAMNAIGGEAIALSSASGGAVHSSLLPDGEIPHVAGYENGSTSLDAGENTAIYVLLRQDPSLAMTAAKTLIKMLTNVIKNPQDEKFRKIRLANASIQSKLVAVPGAIDIFAETGFSRVSLNGDAYLMLATDVFEAERVQSAIDRLEVALAQLQHDFA